MSTIIRITYEPDDMSWHERLDPLIKTIAKQVFWSPPFAGFVELDDLIQEAWVAYLEKRRKYDGLLANPETEKYAHYGLRKACSDFARREMWERLHVNPEDQYHYSKAEVRMLARMWLSGQWDGEQLQDERIDFERGWGRLKPEDCESLTVAYGVGDVPVTGADRMRASRACRRLRGLMCARLEEADWEPESEAVLAA